MTLVASLGKHDPADKRCNVSITKTWRGDFKQFVALLLKDVPIARDKANHGWICGAEFNPEYRHGSNLVGRHFVSLDYDHIAPEDIEKILAVGKGAAFLAYTTWSHVPDHPRLRVWIPLSRPVSAEEYQAVSRKVAARADINLAASESFAPAQFMFRPCRQKDIPFQHWEDTAAPYLDPDKTLGEYDDWKDRVQWPARAGDVSRLVGGQAENPLEKPGIVGDFCRAFTISAAIERFCLPYVHAGGERWTYTAGSRPEGAIVYDDDTKLHSHHDTDPATGQHNAFDLVRMHRFAELDGFDGDTPIAERPSHRAMVELAKQQPEVAALHEVKFADLDAAGTDLAGAPPAGATPLVGKAHTSILLPARIIQGFGKETDLENARRIQKKYGSRIISVAKGFYMWSGTHWAKDDAPVKRLISELSDMVTNEAKAMEARGEDKDAIALRWHWAVTCGSASTLAACERLLKDYLDFKASDLNVAPYLFNCLSGTLDLRTGVVRGHAVDDFITACAPTLYDPAARAPRFELFLREIFKGDASLVAFAKRWFGYCITGETRAQSILFHVGEGGNGKTRLIGVLQYVLGAEYAMKGARGLLSPGSGRGASPEITDLLGKRMVTLTETNRDAEFDEATLKDLTGEEWLKGRNLYEGLFQFPATHKLQIFTNYEPRITGQDAGIWRRIFLLPYDVKYGRPDEVAAGTHHHLKDEKLASKLAAEAPGILAWLVEGAREWYERSLSPPAVVIARTETYREHQDLVGQFLRERTVRDPTGRVSNTQGAESLYGAYKGWAQEMGYRQLGRNRFLAEVKRSAAYVAEDVWQEKGKRYRGLKGLRLLADSLPGELFQ